MMTREEIEKAFKRHLPVVAEVKGANPGTYRFSFISALGTRYNHHRDIFYEDIEVHDTRCNSVMHVTAEQIRLATPEEVLNFKLGGVNNERNV